MLEDAFRGRRPAWEAAGALLVPDTRPYEAMKLRLVNGGHSALAYLGLLRGLETVADAVADPELGAFLERLFAAELAPTLGAVPGVDLDGYREALLARFANARMRHRLEQIATDGARKLPLRLLAPARELLADGREPAGICLAVAAWLRWLAGEGGRSQAAADALHGEVAAAVGGRGQPGRGGRARAGRRRGVRRRPARVRGVPRPAGRRARRAGLISAERPSKRRPAKKKNQTSNAAMARMTTPTTT